MSIKVSVLMSVFNGEQYLREAIESILNQTYTNFEFLIIDDASTDRSMEIIKSYHDPKIRIIKNDKNLGLTKSLNIGIRFAKGEYIARMDADDISFLERFEKQVAFLETHPEIVLVGTSKQIINQNGTVLNTYIALKLPRYDDFLKGNQITHGSIMVRHKIIEEFSGYDELFMKCQDYALWLQISKKYQLYNLSEVLYKSRLHQDCVSLIDEKSIYYHILAIRASKSFLSNEMIKEIEKSGISCLENYFSNKEHVFFHNSIANRYRLIGDLKNARHHCWEIFRREPWNLYNIVNIMRLYLGKSVLVITGYIYTTIENRVHRYQPYNK